MSDGPIHAPDTRRDRVVSVAHLTSVHPPDDPRILIKECGTLAAAGFDVTLVAHGATGVDNTEVNLIEFPRRGGRLRRVLTSAARMYRIAEDLDADLYHVHDPELLPTADRLLRRGRRVIYDAHEYLSKSIAGRPYLPSPVARALGGVVGRYEHRVANRATAVVSATPTIAEQFVRKNAIVVANYPMLEEWHLTAPESPSAFSERPRAAGYVGAITEERCFSAMVSAGRLLSQHDASVHLAGRLAGVGEPHTQGVVYHGVLDRPEVRSLFSSIRVGLAVLKELPNHIDCLPTKSLEYMAAGLPVVVSRSTSRLAGMIDEIGCGVVLRSETPEEIAEAVLDLLDDPVRSYSMGQRGREAVEREYSWEPQGEKLVRLYRNLTNSPAR